MGRLARFEPVRLTDGGLHLLVHRGVPRKAVEPDHLITRCGRARSVVCFSVAMEAATMASATMKSETIKTRVAIEATATEEEAMEAAGDRIRTAIG